jgi:ABC-type glutathione transport system ATPase component
MQVFRQMLIYDFCMPKRGARLKRNFAGAFCTMYTIRGAQMGIIDVVELKKYFPVKKAFAKPQWLKAVDGVSFSVKQGGGICAGGESGSGKTTVARLILKLVPPTAGRILFRQ